MKKTTIVTAKILDYYAGLIMQGVKRFEVRSESLDNVDAIHLISMETGDDLGTYEVLRTLSFTREEDAEAMSLARTTEEQFYKLFPPAEQGGPKRLWAAELGRRVSLESLVGFETELF